MEQPRSERKELAADPNTGEWRGADGPAREQGHLPHATQQHFHLREPSSFGHIFI